MKELIAYKNIRLEFDEQKHQLFVNGERNYFNVTGITGVIDKSGPLMYWAVKLATNYLRDKWLLSKENETQVITENDFFEAEKQHRLFKEKAGNIGDLVHEFAEQFSLGLKPEIPEQENAKNGALAFLKWFDQAEMKVKNPEQIVYSKKYGYWGIADAEATKGKKLYLLDYKTSKGIYNPMRYQVSAYLKAAEEMYKREYEGYWILRFDKETGNFEPLFVDMKEMEKDFSAFLGALEIKKREKELDANKIPF